MVLFGTTAGLYVFFALTPRYIAVVLLTTSFLFVAGAQNGLASTLEQQHAMSGQISAVWNIFGAGPNAALLVGGNLSDLLEERSADQGHTHPISRSAPPSDFGRCLWHLEAYASVPSSTERSRRHCARKDGCGCYGLACMLSGLEGEQVVQWLQDRGKEDELRQPWLNRMFIRPRDDGAATEQLRSPINPALIAAFRDRTVALAVELLRALLRDGPRPTQDVLATAHGVLTRRSVFTRPSAPGSRSPRAAPGDEWADLAAAGAKPRSG